jgi:hypothetical protein
MPADELSSDDTWRVHVDRLRALQRHGCEIMAELAR